MKYLSKETIEMILKDFFSLCQQIVDRMERYRSTFTVEDVETLRNLGREAIDKIERKSSSIQSFIGKDYDFSPSKFEEEKRKYITSIEYSTRIIGYYESKYEDRRY